MRPPNKKAEDFIMTELARISRIESDIIIIRGKQVMIDRDLAKLYEIETKALKQAVNRNKERFPEEFCFELTEEEFENWRSQFVTSKSDKMGLRYAPYAFTEQGVAMLSAVLRSETAVKVSIEIMNAFVQMRHYLQENAGIISRLTNTETQLLEHDKQFKKIDENFSKIFNALESNITPKKEGIFFQGQIFDAYAFFQDIIQTAKKEIILIDGYIDLSILERFAKKKTCVQVTVYTDAKTKLSSLDVQKFNEQYPALTVKHTAKMHDRFLIIDGKKVYHIGASLKDLGKKCFAFELMQDADMLIPALLKNL